MGRRGRPGQALYPTPRPGSRSALWVPAPAPACSWAVHALAPPRSSGSTVAALQARGLSEVRTTPGGGPGRSRRASVFSECPNPPCPRPRAEAGARGQPASFGVPNPGLGSKSPQLFPGADNTEVQGRHHLGHVPGGGLTTVRSRDQRRLRRCALGPIPAARTGRPWDWLIPALARDFAPPPQRLPAQFCHPRESRSLARLELGRL